MQTSDYYLNIHQVSLDTIDNSPNMSDIDKYRLYMVSAAFGSYRAYRFLRDHKETIKAVIPDFSRDVRTAMAINASIEYLVNHSRLGKNEDFRTDMFTMRSEIESYLKEDQPSVRFSYYDWWLKTLWSHPILWGVLLRVCIRYFYNMTRNFVSRNVFGYRSIVQLNGLRIDDFSTDADTVLKEQHFRTKDQSMVLEYLHITPQVETDITPQVETDITPQAETDITAQAEIDITDNKDKKLLIRVEGRGVHYCMRVQDYIKDRQALRLPGQESSDAEMMVLNLCNVSGSTQRAASGIDQMADNIADFLRHLKEKGYQEKNITLHGTCAGSQVTSHFMGRSGADNDINKTHLKMVSDRSFSNFHQLAVGFLNRLRETIRPSQQAISVKQCCIALLWFPIWLIGEAISIVLTTSLNMYLYLSGWNINQIKAIQTVPLVRLYAFQAVANDVTQNDDRAILSGHVADAFMPIRLHVLRWLDHKKEAAQIDSERALYTRMINHVQNGYKVFTNGRTRSGKAHDPHLSPMHQLQSHDFNDKRSIPMAQKIRQFMHVDTTVLMGQDAGIMQCNLPDEGRHSMGVFAWVVLLGMALLSVGMVIGAPISLELIAATCVLLALMPLMRHYVGNIFHASPACLAVQMPDDMVIAKAVFHMTAPVLTDVEREAFIAQEITKKENSPTV